MGRGFKACASWVHFGVETLFLDPGERHGDNGGTFLFSHVTPPELEKEPFCSHIDPPGLVLGVQKGTLTPDPTADAESLLMGERDSV